MNLRLIASGKVLPFTIVQEVRKQVTGERQGGNSLDERKERKGGGFLNSQGIGREEKLGLNKSQPGGYRGCGSFSPG
jgi:hypothetical protein